MLDIRANDQHFPISLDPVTIRSAGMVMPLSGDNGFHIVDAGEVFAGISNLQKLEIGPHVINCTGKYCACIWTSKISRKLVIVWSRPSVRSVIFCPGS